MSKRGFNIRWSPLPETERGEICLGTVMALREFLDGVDSDALVFLGNDYPDGAVPVTPERYPESVNILVASSHPTCQEIVDSWK